MIKISACIGLHETFNIPLSITDSTKTSKLSSYVRIFLLLMESIIRVFTSTPCTLYPLLCKYTSRWQTNIA